MEAAERKDQMFTTKEQDNQDGDLFSFRTHLLGLIPKSNNVVFTDPDAEGSHLMII